MHTRPITNFGGNVQFTPRRLYKPSTEAEVLEVLDRHARGKIRVVGSRHAWSPAIVSDDVLVDLRRLNTVAIERDADGAVWVSVGGGCKIKHLLRKLHARSDATLPSLGLIDEQSIAGAISTATHGAGKHSLSHYAAEIRVAAYDPDSGQARVFVYTDGPELRAARCALGCMGIILSVRIRCVPKYDVAERTDACKSIDDVLSGESEHPLQQFYLLPHRWSWFAQQRAPLPPSGRQNLAAKLYRAYWFFALDVGFHFIITSLAAVLRCSAAIRFFFRHAITRLVLQGCTFVDESWRMLTMQHELFKHLEIEIFVPERHVRSAAEFVRQTLAYCDGAADTIPPLELDGDVAKLHGTFTHHYPICFRRVLPDDTLISMSAGDGPWYALSFITYVEPREPFFALAAFLASSMVRLFGARLHWGKYFPLGHAEVEPAYPNLSEFRQICVRTDPHGVFRNAFASRVLGFSE